ncbi:MAG: hypothetical protein ABL903_14705 [Methylococcales bacterium]
MTVTNRIKFIVMPCVLMACLVLQAAASNAMPYTFTTLNAPGATRGTVAYGINALGQVAGVFYDDKGSHGFVYNGQDYFTLDVPQATNGTFAYGINAGGQVVGDYVDATGKHGFIYNKGAYATLDNPNGFDTNATGINSKGQVVGNFRIGTTGIYGFFYDPVTQVYTTINNPKASAGNTSATGVNDANELVGFFYNTGAHGYSYDGKDYTAFNAPLAAPAGTFMYGFNNTGQMVGVYYDNKGAGNGFVYDGSNYSLLAPPNAKTTSANGINDNGQVAGYYTDSTGSHGFIATPVLDPTVDTQLAFRNLQSVYKAGETLTIALQEQLLVRKQALDLWVAVVLPGGELRYINPDEPGLLSNTAKPYKVAVNVDSVRHAIASFVIPKDLVGHFTFYALYNTPGSDLSNLAQTLRSNIARADIDLR